MFMRSACLRCATFTKAADLSGQTRPLFKPGAMLMDENGTMTACKWKAYVETSVMSSALSPFEVSIACQRFANSTEKTGAMLMDEDGALIGWKTYAEVGVTGQSSSVVEQTHSELLTFLAGAFYDFDLDGDGVLSKIELRSALASLGLPADDIDVQALFFQLDCNADESIQLNEWLNRVPRELQVKLQDHAGAASWRRHHGGGK